MTSIRSLGRLRCQGQASRWLSPCHFQPALARVGRSICTTVTLREPRKPSFDGNAGRNTTRLPKLVEEIDSEGPKDAQRQGRQGPHPIPAETKPFSEEANNLAKGFGFLFDCDGVLYQGGKQIESAAPALRLCRSHDAGYLFLTNGGGSTTEAEKAVSLHKKMGIPSDEDLIDGRVIQSHTPFSKIFKEEKKEDDIVYTTSLDPDKAREIVKSYGFKNVITAADLLEHNEHIFPFKPRQIGETTAQPLPKGVELWNGADPLVYKGLDGTKHLKIDHIFILNDPRDWALETQIIYDLLVSHRGFYGTQSRRCGDTTQPHHGYQRDGQPGVWISNVDMVWKTEHPMNRFGTGAFLHAFRGLWKSATGWPLRYNHMGKPSRVTYDYAHRELLEQAGPLGMRRVYMVGDNPESDIRGALEYKPSDGTQYVPILVKTGVWRETQTEMKPNWEPAVIVDDVLDAVVWAMRQEGIDIDRQSAMEKLSSSAGQ